MYRHVLVQLQGEKDLKPSVYKYSVHHPLHETTGRLDVRLDSSVVLGELVQELVRSTFVSFFIDIRSILCDSTPCSILDDAASP